MQRRSSDDGRAPDEQPANPNVFDDEYALDPDEDDFMPAVSDGFRPAGMSGHDTAHGDRQGHDRSDSPRPSFTATKSADGNDLRRLASRNSTMKTPFARESISNEARNSGTHHTRGPSSQATAALQHRASVSSTGSFATTTNSEGAFGTGPSHPYGMYPQTTMVRSPSVTTSSTQHQPQRSLSLQRPTHPYAMYQQNVVEDDEPPVPAVQAIPVGFPGRNNGFHRQIGPDGEDQDIIGPDGHTEQLPPYSRYPEEGPTKAAMAAEASATPVVSPVVTPAASSLNTSDEALAAQAAPVSPLDRSVLQQQETHSVVASPIAAPPPALLPQVDNVRQGPASLASTERTMSEKQESDEEANSWRKKKIWGKIPMGVAVVLLILLLVFAVTLGAAIGTFVARNKDKNDHGSNNHNKDDHGRPLPQQMSPTILFDATPISTPSSLSPLPTGPYALPLGMAQESSPNCLGVASQLSAWSCKMTFAPLILNITAGAGSTPTKASLGSQTAADGTIQYGVQPPKLDFQDLQLVLDMDYKAYGPAFHFQTMNYNKTVVLNQYEFTGGPSSTPVARKRDDKPPFRHRFQVAPGDFPWVCYWNQTYIEGYIYANDNSTAASMTNMPTAYPSGAYGSSMPVETGAAATASAASAQSSQRARLRRRGDSDYIRPVPYPRIVKIEERRLPNSPQPYCQQMQILDDARMVPAADSSQRPIIVSLQEDDPTMQEFIQAAGQPPPPSSTANSTQRRRSNLEKRSDPSGACHCQWMFQ